MAAHDLDSILNTLNQHQQRATYSAVAALIGRTPRRLMRDKPREPANSWIVSKSTGLPTGYADDDLHPRLMSNSALLRTGDELAAWLANH